MEYTLLINKLTVFNELKESNCFKKLVKMFQLIGSGSEIKRNQAYYSFVSDLLEENCTITYSVASPWQNYLLEKILTADNLFSRQGEMQANLSPILETVVQNDFKYLEKLYNIDWQAVEEQLLGEALDNSIFSFKNTPILENYDAFPEKYHEEKRVLKEFMDKNKGWENLLPEIMAFFKKWGTGEFARYWIFKYNGKSLEGISKPDTIRLQQLIGLNTQRNQLVENTKQFVKGYTANNVLLYGDRGTGKSSTVKGIVHDFGEMGLRLVEVSLKGLIRLPYLLKKLAKRPQRFILFIDDLSFEENETQYKELKAVLEGGVVAQPDNVLIYATSNRRHLIKEKFADRDMSYYVVDNDEVRTQDTLQEKLSLSDRFGMTIYFTSPIQKEYLEIVHALAKEKNIEMEEKMLDRMALQWELMHNSRSGRTAKQFIDNLSGRLAMESADKKI